MNGRLKLLLALSIACSVLAGADRSAGGAEYIQAEYI